MIKKLFTSILLLGAVGYAQAQVTVTGYDATNKKVTINYDRAQGVATESNVQKAINDYFGPDGLNLTLDQRKANVSTIKLTGDWDNKDTDKNNGKTIKAVIDEFSTEESRDTLDLSACQKFMSQFVSVVDYCNNNVLEDGKTCPGYQQDQFEAEFTANNKLPDEVTTMKLTKETTVGDIFVENNNPQNKLDKNRFDNEAAYNDFINELNNGTHTGTYGYTYKPNPNQEWHGNISYNEAGASWYWVSDDTYNQKQIVINYNSSYFCDGNEVKVDNPSALTDNGDGTYTYTLTITHENTPFAINADYKLGGIIFPNSDKFTYIPGGLFKDDTGLEKVVLSNDIVAIGNKAFGGCTALEEVNFPASLSEIGYAAFKSCAIKAAKLKACNNIKRIRFELFQDCTNLTTVSFPTGIIEIQKEAFLRTGITKADMSECHDLRMIAQYAFATCTSLNEVKVCSHPKKIKGDEGKGAFNECYAIKTVEVVGCDNTNLVECICENNAFDPKITYVQTAIDNIETMGARLIFPEGMQYDQPMKSSAGNVNTQYLGYASAFDYFVGNYKEGIPFKNNQSCLEAYFKFAPRGVTANAVNWPTTGETTQVTVASDVAMKNKYGISNGWHEFMNVSAGIIINNEDQNFLRTYSRTRGSGPVLLKTDFGITAYRAVDYLSTKDEYVANKRGDYVFVPGEKNKLHPGTDEYLTKKQCKDAGINIKGLKTYSYATVAGTLYLRPLHPKYKNSDEVNEDYSYIPELTGVVLYSNKTAEDIFLIFAPYTDTDYDLSIQYPHTGKVRRESTRLESEPDDINMLQGSYGEDTGVAPVDPWTYADEENFKGGTYNPAQIDYRQFGYSISQEKWIRLQPGRMKYNRAFAKIPAEYFNNHNEGKEDTGEFPDFTLSDVPEETTPADSEGEANTLLLIDYSFDDVAAETDGIKTINETDHVVDANVWYTLQGVKVTQPVKGGVYIHNNKKVVIK